MTEYEIEFYKNIYNRDYLNRNASNDEIVTINKIIKTSNDGPFINSDIKELILLKLGNRKLEQSEMVEYIKKAIFHIKKGNLDELILLLKDNVK